VLVGLGTSPGMVVPQHLGVDTDARTQAKRVLTFALDAKAGLPPHTLATAQLDPDPTYQPNPALAGRGAMLFAQRCLVCHGLNAQAGGIAPDLRQSPIPLDSDAFARVLRDGALVPGGMPRFEELRDTDRDAIRQYLRERRAQLTATAHN
jgi:quinohemoprotein ethanol dehydrogenase